MRSEMTLLSRASRGSPGSSFRTGRVAFSSEMTHHPQGGIRQILPGSRSDKKLTSCGFDERVTFPAIVIA
jgi:hypothetical protein